MTTTQTTEKVTHPCPLRPRFWAGDKSQCGGECIPVLATGAHTFRKPAWYCETCGGWSL